MRMTQKWEPTHEWSGRYSSTGGVHGAGGQPGLGRPRRHRPCTEPAHRDHDGWRAVCPWPGPSFTEARQPFGTPISSETLSELDANSWELHHIDEDFAETRDLAAEHCDKAIELISLWYVEAGKYGVLPIDGGALAQMTVERPTIATARTSYTFRPGTQSLPPSRRSEGALNRPHSVTADVEISADGAEGVLMSQGSMAGG